MAIYFTDRKCTSTFCLNVCRGNVMKDVSGVAIVLFQLAVASGPPQVPRVLCDPWTARRRLCAWSWASLVPHERSFTLGAVSSPWPHLFCSFRSVLVMISRAEGKSRLLLTRAHTEKYDKEKRREGY